MKQKYYLLGFVVMLLITSSCKDDTEVISPGAVTDIESSAGYGEVMMKWTNPSDETFYYVDITFVDSKGLSRSRKVSHFTNGDTIPGFGDTNPYTFTLTAYSYSGGASSPVILTVSPLEPAFMSVANTVDMVPDFGGAVVSWVNETGKQATVRVIYTDNSGQKVISLFPANETGKGYISGLSATARTFNVIVTDEADNTSAEHPFEITPLEESAINKLQWTVVDFSTQEPAEGAPNGVVTAVFDGDVSTFWHTQWNGGSPGYPHWFIIDMGREVTVSRFECSRRQGDSRGQTACQFFISVDGETWVDQGVYDFDSSTDNAQSYRMTTNPQARYFKYVAITGPNFYAFLGEITVYGTEN